VDNSSCSRDVKSLKIKLHRAVVLSEQVDRAATISQFEYLEEIKIPCDIKGKTKAEKTIMYSIPAEEAPEKLRKLQLHPTMEPLAHTLSVTSARSIFSIKYKLDVYIKHQSKTELGKGNCVSFPICIRT
jgi:hypothetical protein